MRRPSLKGILGIIVSDSKGPLPFSEPDFNRKLCISGSSKGLLVYVFTPSALLTEHHQITGYSYEQGRWSIGKFPPPDIIYDRYFPRSRKDQQLKKLALSILSNRHPFIYFARGLTGKWSVYEALKQDPTIAQHLPQTAKYSGPAMLTSGLDLYNNQVFLKPQYGTHGKGTVHITRAKHKGRTLIVLIGRDSNNNVFIRKFTSQLEGLRWVHHFVGKRNYLLQPYLELTNSQDMPFDIRVLMQKNSKGIWEMTGRAARIGRKHSVTSNLHGGGTARKAAPFLNHEYGELDANTILTQIDQLSEMIPPHLESHFGRLAELGVDFGVDRKGQIWILEVNSKPGRSSFSQIGDEISAAKSIDNPIEYARYLLLNKP